MTGESVELEKREGLPDALRVLLEGYPREAWEADPGFSALIRFWLDRHVMFRRMLATMQAETETFLDKGVEGPVFASRLARLGTHFLQNLHGHHQIEDLHYFPRLKGLEPRLERGFDILDRDHHAIDGHLAALAEDANAALVPAAGGDDAISGGETEALRKRLTRTERFLNRHLIDEEDLIVPVLLRHVPEGLV